MDEAVGVGHHKRVEQHQIEENSPVWPNFITLLQHGVEWFIFGTTF